MREARSLGVPTPLVYFVDLNRTEIIMQKICGTRLKDILTNSPKDSIEALCVATGRTIAKLHEGRIIHGDLTTSNFIVSNRNNIVLIDFGLSFVSTRLEDQAVDIHLLKEVLSSAHCNVANTTLDNMLEGYSEVAGKDHLQKLLTKVREVERRGRYARVI